MYQSGKTYGHEVGFSCAFRQWRASSHCNQLHGYALAFRFVFETKQLDENGWVVDFGSLKSLKTLLEAHFDHKVVVAADDPHIDYFRQGVLLGVLELVELKDVGCEKFAEYVFGLVQQWLVEQYALRITLVSVTVSEHGANHATYINPDLDITNKLSAIKQVVVAQDGIAGSPITLDDLEKIHAGGRE